MSRREVGPAAIVSVCAEGPQRSQTASTPYVERQPAIDEAGGIVFAHQSEAEFAKILDFYQIHWQYEARSFPIDFREDGSVARYFTPDFYLPEFDLYVELTTLRQRLVTKKNRKLRLLRELYPDVKIKLFYNRDVRGLLAKYGIRLLQAVDAEPSVT